MFQGLSEEPVANGPRANQIDAAAQQLLQGEEQPEIRVGSIHAARRIELDQKINVAALSAKPVGGGGTEELQAPHVEAATQVHKRCSILFNDRLHR